MPVSNMPGDAVDWTIREALRSDDLPAILLGFCERLAAAGVPVWRVQLAATTIDPTYRGMTITWHADAGVEHVLLPHDTTPEDYWHQSPFYHMFERGLTRARWSLAEPDECSRFSVFETLAAAGGNDYLAHMTGFGGYSPGANVGAGRTGLLGIATSWVARRPDRFSDADVAAIDAALPALALAAYRAALLELADALMATYVGPDTGRRVLAGNIRRGAVTTISAVLLVADFRDFTALAETYPGQDLVRWLNEHLDAVAEPIEEAGGEVLKFIGDGLIAVFRIENGDEPAACRAALAAAEAALARTAALNLARGEPALALDIAIHAGEAMYGNIGSRRRLDFTVIGSAVNTASRIEALCARLGHHLLFSGPVAACCERPVLPLGSHRLRGVGDAIELFTLG